jgi:dipeptidyl aminopeptidase/acylaminoacyl peptidase
MNHRLAFPFLCLSFFLLLSTDLLAQPADRLSPESLWKLGRVSLDDVSPDGETLLYGVTYYDLPANKGNRDLYIIPVEGGTARKITAFPGSEANGRFRPDGQKIGFLYQGQLWEMNPDGSDKRKVSEQHMNGFAYGPGAFNILFIDEVAYGKSTQDLYPDLPKANARIIDGLMYRHWDQWEDGLRSNIFYQAYTDGRLVGKAVNIMEGEAFDAPLQPFGGMEQIAWRPDGKAIAYTCKKVSGKEYAESTNSDIYLYELKSRKTTNLSASNPGYDRDPVFSPDGKYLIWNSMERAGFEADRNRIIQHEMSSGKQVELTEGLDRDAEHPVFSENGKTLFFVSGEKATSQLFSLQLKNLEVNQLTTGDHNYYDFFVAGKDLVARRASMSMPHEVYRVNARSGAAEQLTFTNQQIMGRMKLGKVEKRMVKTTDGKNMLVWMIFPPDFDPNKKYPSLLYCQGGPQSAVSQFFSYRWNFQLMAANGYIIVAPNRRGLPSFGREWNDQISGDWGGQAMKDYLSAIDAAKQEPYVDENRLGAVGASYGGYSVYWLAGNHDKRFKCFISHCGLFNLESWYATTEEMFFANWDLKGAYWKKNPPISYQKHSPHRYVGNWDAPMLVIHGAKDFRVPVSEGMQAFHAAQLQGVPSRFLYFPDEGHWVLSPQNGVLWHRQFFDWLDQWLKKP